MNIVHIQIQLTDSVLFRRHAFAQLPVRTPPHVTPGSDVCSTGTNVVCSAGTGSETIRT